MLLLLLLEQQFTLLSAFSSPLVSSTYVIIKIVTTVHCYYFNLYFKWENTGRKEISNLPVFKQLVQWEAISICPWEIPLCPGHVPVVLYCFLKVMVLILLRRLRPLDGLTRQPELEQGRVRTDMEEMLFPCIYKQYSALGKESVASEWDLLVTFLYAGVLDKSVRVHLFGKLNFEVFWMKP